MSETTKQEAVARLIDAALRAIEQDDEVSATTLAGAAEGAMPGPEDKHLFQMARDAMTGFTDKDGKVWQKKEVISLLNAERDWLKHYNEGQPASMDLTGAFWQILRAISKFYAVYGREAETETMKNYFAEARRFHPADG